MAAFFESEKLRYDFLARGFFSFVIGVYSNYEIWHSNFLIEVWFLLAEGEAMHDL